MEGYRVPVHLTYLGNVLVVTLHITRCFTLGVITNQLLYRIAGGLHRTEWKRSATRGQLADKLKIAQSGRQLGTELLTDNQLVGRFVGLLSKLNSLLPIDPKPFRFGKTEHRDLLTSNQVGSRCNYRQVIICLCEG
jgi:hypothetical protein